MKKFIGLFVVALLAITGFAYAASNFKIEAAAANAMLDKVTTDAGATATLKFYDGAQVSPGGSISTQHMLVSCALSNPIAAGASAGVLTLSSVSAGTGTAAASTGTNMTWWALTASNGTTILASGTVGTSAADVIVNNVNIAEGQTLTIPGGTITAGNL
jgi:hypothetical protein